MKTKIIMGILVLGLISVFSFAGEREFGRGSWFVTPQLVLYKFAPNFGASVEYGMTENIGVGATLMLAFWSDTSGGWKISQSSVTPSIEGYYHFTGIRAEKLDVYAGASLGYRIYSWSWDAPTGSWDDADQSEVFLSPFGGVRYYISDKVAANLNVNFSLIGETSGIGGLIGITIRLK
jgi:opacity protein-like surface antigen